MAQHDMSIADQNGASFLVDLNNAMAALVSNNSAATQPAVTTAYMWWADTTAGMLKRRNGANTAWQDVMLFSQSFINVNNTSDASKPISIATQAALDQKQVSLDSKSDQSHNHSGVYEPANSTIVKSASGVTNIWTGTQAAYDALTPNANTLYAVY